MAHKLAKTNGEVAFASVKEIPWHGLGKIVARRMNASECIQMAGLDYRVDKANVFAQINSVKLKVPDKFATYRADTNDVFDIVGDRYHVVQNEDAFVFFDAIVGEGKAIYETAGALGKGERVFITAKLPTNIQVGKDVIDQYLFLTSAHDGNSSIKVAFTPVRIVCNNTLQMALNESKRMIAIRHTSNAKENLKIAHTLMGIVGNRSENMEEMLNATRKVRISDRALRQYIEMAMQPRREQLSAGELKEFSTRFTNTIDSIIEYALAHETQTTAETKGTLYGAYNAVTGYFQNVKTFKTQDDKLANIMFGTAARKSAHAMNIAVGVLTNKIKLAK